MNCTRCHSSNTSVLSTDPSGQSIRRRRKCDDCNHRFTTYESTENVAAQLEELRRHLRPVMELVTHPET